MKDNEIIETLKEISALLMVQTKRGVSQSVLIKELSAAGFQPKRIAEIVGTTSNTVRVTLHHSKKQIKK